MGAGVISGDTLLKNVSVAADRDLGGIDTMARYFAQWGDETVSWLFTENKSNSLVGQRAIGSLLHMLQDTYCASHAKRVATKDGRDETRLLKGFNVHTEQSASVAGWLFSKWRNRHGLAVQLQEGGVKESGGAKEAVEIGARVLAYYKANTPRQPDAKRYLKKIFGLQPEAGGSEAPGGPRAAEQKRLTSVSGRLFRKKWLADLFKSESSVFGQKRPDELKTIDSQLERYKAASKQELLHVAEDVDLKGRYGLMMLTSAYLDKFLELAMAYAAMRPRLSELDGPEETRVSAVRPLIENLEQDKKELDPDLEAIHNANRERAQALAVQFVMVGVD